MLRVFDEKETEGFVSLEDEWYMTPVSVGDYINIIGTYEEVPLTEIFQSDCVDETSRFYICERIYSIILYHNCLDQGYIFS